MIEHFDILDENGKPTGKRKSRTAAHRDGDWHRTVHVWIINTDHELLIQKRAPSIVSHPNLWDVSVAGHVSAGDDTMTTILKETEEELGIKLDPKNIEYLFTVQHQCVLQKGLYVANHFNDVYLVDLDIDPSHLHLQQEEVAEVKFVHFVQLQEMMRKKKADFVPHDGEYAKLFALLAQRHG